MFLLLHHAAFNGIDPHDDAFLRLTEAQCASECYLMLHNCNLRLITLFLLRRQPEGTRTLPQDCRVMGISVYSTHRILGQLNKERCLRSERLGRMWKLDACQPYFTLSISYTALSPAVHLYPLQNLVQQLDFKRARPSNAGKSETQGQTPEERKGCHSEKGMRSLARVGS